MYDFFAKEFREVSTLSTLLDMTAAGILLAQAGKTSHAIVVLPPGAQGRIVDANHRRWLSRGRVAFAEPDSEMLLNVLQRIGAPLPESGLAALRFWGQTGERSSAWMAAADPVHLETRLHSLRMRSLRPDELPKSDLRVLFDHLQATLGGDNGFSFARIGHNGYIRGESSVGTAPVSASVLHGLPPDEFGPAGESAATYHQLLGELQMVLHDHEVNSRRAAAGQPEINSLWLWGGGVVAEAERRPLPKLIANDPLFRGYWSSCIADVEGWDGDIDEIFASSSAGFVAVMPDLAPGDAALAFDDCLARVQRMLKRNIIKSATLLCRDGLSIEINRWDAMRFWRRISPLLEKTKTDD